MSKIRNGKTEEGKAEWLYFRKPKFKRKSKLRQAMWIAKMLSVVKCFDDKISQKRIKGTLVSKKIEYGQKN